MSGRVLLVTGSRALADTPAAEAWARDKLRAALDWWEPTLIVHGGCPRSPDAWAHELAECAARVYFADGRLIEYGARWVAPNHHGEWREPGPRRTWLLPGNVAAPLLRNAVMTCDVSERRVDGIEVLVVGLTAPWASTRGTEHTLARAAGYGLRSIARACPAELGPVRS